MVNGSEVNVKRESQHLASLDVQDILLNNHLKPVNQNSSKYGDYVQYLLYKRKFYSVTLFTPSFGNDFFAYYFVLKHL